MCACTVLMSVGELSASNAVYSIIIRLLFLYSRTLFSFFVSISPMTDMIWQQCNISISTSSACRQTHWPYTTSASSHGWMGRAYRCSAPPCYSNWMPVPVVWKRRRGSEVSPSPDLLAQKVSFWNAFLSPVLFLNNRLTAP